MTISVSVNNIHLLRMLLGGDEAAARSLPGICGSWTFQRDRPPPSSSHPRLLSWTTSSPLLHCLLPLLLLLLLQVQALRKFSPSVISHQYSATFSFTLDLFPLRANSYETKKVRTLEFKHLAMVRAGFFSHLRKFLSKFSVEN